MPDRDLIAEGRAAMAEGEPAWSVWKARNGHALIHALSTTVIELGRAQARVAELERQLRPAPTPASRPGLPERECHLCGRTGRRLFIKVAEGWKCQAWAACRERQIQREAAANA